MEIKIKKYLFWIKMLTIGALVILASSQAFAGWGASGGGTNCYGMNCVTFHNNGYTRSQFPPGLSFASFNGYKDQITTNGRTFDERQFMRHEYRNVNAPGMPNPNPWNNSSNYDFNRPTSRNLIFVGDQPQHVGFYAYLHNNGVKNDHPALGTKVKIRNWSSAPKKKYNPKFSISSTSTRPPVVTSDVTLTGNVPFTLEPVEAWLDNESGWTELFQSQLQSLVSSSGFPIYSNVNNPAGRVDSSSVHYVVLYVEFLAVPQPGGDCQSLTITNPSEQLLLVDENGFIDTNLSYSVVTDPNVVTGYRVLSTQNSIDFNNSGQSNVVLPENQFSTVMDGGPAAGQLDTVQVWALDENGQGIQACWDSFNVRQEEEGGPECDVFNAIADPPGTDAEQVPINEFITINLDPILDTEGNIYTDNGQPPIIRYCYRWPTEIQFLPDFDPINPILDSQGCALAPATDTMNIIASRAGSLDIEVVGAERECYDQIKTAGEEVGECIKLDIKQSDFTADRTNYSVTVKTEPKDADYQVEWFVDSDTGNGMSPVELDSNEIDLDDYNYNFTPGDTLVARATRIDDPNNICIDQRTSLEEECIDLTLDTDFFERGRDNLICIDSIEGWTLDENDELYVSVDGGARDEVDLFEDGGDLCFILTENMLEGADEVEVWVPGWKSVCKHELRRKVEPPEFDKRVKNSERGEFYSKQSVASFGDSYIDYKITYEHKNDEPQNVTITDTIGTEEYIQGYIANPDDPNPEDEPKGGRIYYDETTEMIVMSGNHVVENCADLEELEEDTLCYEGRIDELNGVTIRNAEPREEIKILYRGEIIESKVTPENCSNPDHEIYTTGVCGEVYPNTSEYDDGDSSAQVIIPCPFIIIRSGGEVFLENPFDYGVDTLACSEIRNVPTPVITPTPPAGKTPSTGPADASILKVFNDRLCKSEGVEGFEDIERISSLICEVTLETAEDLTQYAIVQDINRNVQLFARYDPTLNSNPRITGSIDLERLNSVGNVHVYNAEGGQPLTIGGTFEKGAHTIVVLNNDVYINKDIKFKDPTDLTDPRKVPSLAIIVINGSIVYDPSVSQTEAVLFVQEGERANSGQICEAPISKKQSEYCIEDDDLVKFNTDNRLIHYGSIYGDIQHLFKYRALAGDPTKEEGAILIRFDNRVNLNTPPLLNKLVDVSLRAF